MLEVSKVEAAAAAQQQFPADYLKVRKITREIAFSGYPLQQPSETREKWVKWDGES
jgi:hypothetical protein